MYIGVWNGLSCMIISDNTIISTVKLEVVAQRFSVKEMFLEISQNSQ